MPSCSLLSDSMHTSPRQPRCTCHLHLKVLGKLKSPSTRSEMSKCSVSQKNRMCPGTVPYANSHAVNYLRMKLLFSELSPSTQFLFNFPAICYRNNNNFKKRTWHTSNATILYIEKPTLNPTKPTHIPLVTFRIFQKQKSFQTDKPKR